MDIVYLHPSLEFISDSVHYDETPVKDVIFSYFSIALSILGVVLNCVTIVIFSRKAFSSSYTFYVRSLACVDSFTLIFTCLVFTPGDLVNHLVSDPEELFHSGTLIQLYVHAHAFLELLQALVTLYTLVVVVDCYMFESKPDNYLSWAEIKVAHKVVFIVLGITVILHIPNLLQCVTKVQIMDGEVFTSLCLSTLYLWRSVQAYSLYLYALVFIILPYAAILFYVTGMAVRLCRRWTLHKDADGLLDTSQIIMLRGCRSLKTVFVVGIMRLINVLPFIIRVFEKMSNVPIIEDGLLPCVHYPGYVKFVQFGDDLDKVILLMSMLNCSCKFFVYYFTLQPFGVWFKMSRGSAKNKGGEGVGYSLDHVIVVKGPRYRPQPKQKTKEEWIPLERNAATSSAADSATFSRKTAFRAKQRTSDDLTMLAVRGETANSDCEHPASPFAFNKRLHSSWLVVASPDKLGGSGYVDIEEIDGGDGSSSDSSEGVYA